MSLEIGGNAAKVIDSGPGDRVDIFARPLREAKLTFTTPRESGDEINSILANAQDEGWIDDSDGTKWRVVTWSSNYSNDHPSMTWDVAVTEMPTEEISTIDMLGITCTVEWSEIWHPEGPGGKPTTIIVEAILSEIEHQTVSDKHWRQVDQRIPEYFPVTLHGSGEATISVRFGKLVWQDTARGYLNHITLVSERGDSDESLKGGTFANMNQPSLNRTSDIATRTERVLDALLERLQSSDLLSEDDILHIRAAAGSEFTRTQWDELRRVNDVADYR